MSIEIVGDDIVITGKEHGRELKQMGARWDEKRGAWVLPATRMNAQAIYDARLGSSRLSVDVDAPGARPSDPRLYAYQRHAIARLETARHGLLLCLSPGLGKTAVAVKAADAIIPLGERIVVVAPASLLRTWEREIKKWQELPGIVYVVSGAIDFKAAHETRWIVVSWDKVARDPGIWGGRWPLWILDESVLTKSRASRRFKAMDYLRRNVGRFWLLSGSPTTRHADDLWAQLHLLWPRAYPSYWRFAERYCVVEETQWARVVTATRAGRDAAEENSDLILVVNQEDVLDLPEYLFETIDVELAGAQARAYAAMQQTFIAELGDGTEVVAANEIARLQKLQQIASCWDGNSAKRDALVDVIRRYESPYLVWTHWRETATDLFLHLAAAGVDTRVVTGDTPDRDAIIEAYKRGDHECLVLSLGVGKFGHTLTNVKTIFYVDRSWNADDFFQSMHRVRRIGLEHCPVVVSVNAVDTVDDIVNDNLEGKLGGISRMTRSHLATLLRGLGR